MANLDKAFARLWQVEFSGAVKLMLHENKKDKGGLTYAGIARNYWKNWRGWQIIDKAIAGRERTKALLQQVSVEVYPDKELQYLVKIFYQQNFWNTIRGDEIKYQSSAEEMFLFGVNAGVGRSIEAAQKAVGLNPDRIFGKMTMEAINAMDPSVFSGKFTKEEQNHYSTVIKKDPSQITFRDGWIKRSKLINADNAAKIV